jgi:hypothetical protein
MLLNSISLRISTLKKRLKVEDDFKEIYEDDEEFADDVDSLDLDD